MILLEPARRAGRRTPGKRFLLSGGVAGLLLLSSGCAENVNDILEEARRGDPESVREAVVALGDVLTQKERAGYPYDEGDKAAIEYLKQVAETAPDAINRACALSSLGRLERPEMTDLFVKSLEDKGSWVVRLEAAKALANKPDPRAAPALARQLEAESNLEVRLPILKALAAAGGDDALKALVEVFLDRSTRYRFMKLTAYDALRKLSGKNFEFEDFQAWRKYYVEHFPGTRNEEEAGQPQEAESPAARKDGAEKEK